MRWPHAVPCGTAALCTLLAMAGCSVEDPSYDAGSTTDGGVADTGTGDTDAGVTCTEVPTLCGIGEFCTDEGVCSTRDVPCSSSSACAVPDVCVRPVVASSTLTEAGRCEPPPHACIQDAECSPGVCLAVGVCGSRAARATLDDRTLVPLVACANASECGLNRVCRDGVCAGCLDNSDCNADLRCNEGRCIEPLHCDGPEGCFASNSCQGGRCLRDSSGCEADSGNDSISTAQDIEAGAYLDLSICGVEEDWYAVEVPAGYGLELVLSSTASQATLTADVLTSFGDRPRGLTRLDAPGVTVIRVPSQDALSLRIGVRSIDQSGDYDLVVRYVAGLCTTDPMQMYGPGLSIPSNITFEGTLCAGVSDTASFDVQTGDRLEVELEMLGDFSDRPAPQPALSLLDANGASVGSNATADLRSTVTTTPLANAQRLDLVAEATRVPSIGAPYQVRLVRRLAGRAGACQSATTIDMSAGTAQVSAFLGAAGDIGRPDCSLVSDAPDFAEGTRRDDLFTVTASSADVLMVATAQSTAGTAPKLSIALLSDCEDDTSTLACDTAIFARSRVQTRAVLPAGQTRTVVVSSDGTVEDVQYDLHIEYVPLSNVPDDSCPSATPLLSSGSQTVHLYQGGGTAGLRNTDALWADRVTAQCSIFDDDDLAAQGVDRFFSLQLDPGELAAVELTGPLGGVLWSALSCDNMPGTCQQAALRDLSNPVLRATFTASTAGLNHIVVVDGSGFDQQGSYTLRTVRNAQCLSDSDCQGAGFNRCSSSPCRCDDYQCQDVPANSSCNGPAVIPLAGGFGADSIVGSTGAANNDFSLSCLSRDGSDVVYSIEVPEAAIELVARVVGASFDPALEIRQGTCTDSALTPVWCVDDVRYPDVLLPEVRVAEPEAGTYYIVVDAFAGEGAFTLEVEVL